MTDPSGFREIVLSTSTSGPVPLIAGLFLAFAMLALAGSVYAGPLWWVPVTFAAVAGLYAISIVTWSLFRRPELSRSERHEVAQRAMELIGGDNLTPETIDAIAQLMSERPAKKVGKSRGALR